MSRASNPVLAAVAGIIALAALLPAPLAAQGVDRTRPPKLGTAPTPRLPAVASATLPNGLRLHVVPMREVPLVHVSLAIPGGGRRDDGRPGLASFTANMLDEGADTLDAFGIAAEAEYLGATLATGAAWDEIGVTLRAPKRTLDRALDLMADVTLRPTFASAEVKRQRDLRLAQILQQRDRPEVVASLAFNAIVYPEGHPYHDPLGGDSASTARLDSAAVRDFYRRTVVPRGATMVVTGDVTLAEARRLVQKHFGAWRGAAAAPAGDSTPAAPAPSRTTVYLVDKPGAEQSVITVGAPGVARNVPDYAALQVMNTILGGSFSSRLNTNLRETKGYTYGARSGFTFRPDVPGPFVAGASVRTDATDSSLVEFFRELRAIREAPPSAEELDRAKAYIALGLASEVETTAQVAALVEELLDFGLPLGWYSRYVPAVRAVTAADVQRVARKYLEPGRLAVVVVGDLKTIRAGIEATGIGPVSLRDFRGQPLP